MVRPQLEYAAAIWDPFTAVKQQKVEMVQRRAARYVCNNYSRQESVTKMLEHLKWRSLEQRRADIRLILFYKIVHGLVAVDIKDQLMPALRLTRHSHPMAFIIPSESAQYIQKSFLPRTIAQWNMLPPHIAMASTLDDFKSSVATVLH